MGRQTWTYPPEGDLLPHTRNILRLWRQTGLSATDYCAAIGVERNSLRAWRIGRQSPSLATPARVALYHQVAIGSLVDDLLAYKEKP